MFVRSRALLVLAGLLVAFTGCRPADLEENLPSYQRLVVLARQEGDGDFLWLLSNAPPEARRLMASLQLGAVIYNDSLGTVYFKRGGGTTPERGYVYRLPSYDSTRADRWDADARRVRDRWYAVFSP